MIENKVRVLSKEITYEQVTVGAYFKSENESLADMIVIRDFNNELNLMNANHFHVVDIAVGKEEILKYLNINKFYPLNVEIIRQGEYLNK